MTQPLLEIRAATKVYGGGAFGLGKKKAALENFELVIEQTPATITAIAGESGSGKTTLANAVLGFITLSAGEITYLGRDIARMNRAQRRECRRQIQPIFQDPFSVYNPFYKARHIFDLVIRRFGIAKNRREAEERIHEALRKVGLRGEEVLDRYPHQLSGGQRQRMMVARAYLTSPRLIVADEPVSMVDASLRSMILDIMLRLRDEEGISFIYITHDLSTAYQIADRMILLYRGRIVEQGKTVDVIENPKHPYAKLLIGSVPRPDPTNRWTPDFHVPDELELE